MGTDLQATFLAFAQYGIRNKVVHDIDGKNFSKMCKDCSLTTQGLTATDVDLIFAKVKDKTARRMTYSQFLRAVEMMALKRGVTVEAVAGQILNSGGPFTRATTAEYVKFHDDKTTYTGVYARGGPTNVDKDKVADLSDLLDRTPADVRGVKSSSSPPRSHRRSVSPDKGRLTSPPLPAAPSPPRQRLKPPVPKFTRTRATGQSPPRPSQREPLSDVHSTSDTVTDTATLAGTTIESEAPVGPPPAAIDWPAVSAKLPAGSDEASKARRAEMWMQFDPNSNGYLSLAEVDKGIREILNLDGLFEAKPAIIRAFQAAKASAATGSTLGEDFVEKHEFRLLLSYLRIYFELFHMFDVIDTSNDRRINAAEFASAAPRVEAWGLKVVDPAAEFASIDTNGGGVVLFDEMAKWAMAHKLDLEDDDE